MGRPREKRVWAAPEVDSITVRGKRALEIFARMSAGTWPERNPLRRLRTYEEESPHLLDWIQLVMELQRSLMSSAMKETPNANLPWTAQEDDVLVAERAEGRPMHVIANDLGRSPAACATRLSTLTGIPRSDLVEAYIEGVLDHEGEVRGLFTGRVRKLADHKED